MSFTEYKTVEKEILDTLQLPELGWRYGYQVVLGVIVLLCSGLWLGFKRSGWL